jgi:hypothetical protein
MPLSRHFYSLDEVQAALLYTTTRNNPSEALFWCQEMILSGCVSEAISTLFQSWLWNTGPMRLQWLVDAWKTLASDELSEDDVLLTTYRLSSIHHSSRDNSLWNVLVLTTKNPDKMPDTITRKTPQFIPSDDTKEIYFVCAMFQGKAHSAWWISQFIEEERLWILLDWFAENVNTPFQDQYKTCLEALKNYEQLLGYKSAEYDIITRCSAVLMMCINNEKQEMSFRKQATEIDKDNSQTLNELSASVGRRDRRVYQIPNSCLYGTTLRGRSKWAQNNFVQLNNVEKYLVGCPFWDEVISEYGTVNEQGEIEWQSDDKMEEFYETFFPDDIPDEWSKKDKEKSHGDGVLGPKDKPTIWKYSRNFLSRVPQLAWNTSKTVNSYLEGIDISDCSVERLIELYKAPEPLSEEDLKKLKPVHKIKMI